MEAVEIVVDDTVVEAVDKEVAEATTDDLGIDVFMTREIASVGLRL